MRRKELETGAKTGVGVVAVPDAPNAFAKYKPQEASAQRTGEVGKNAKLERMLRAYNEAERISQPFSDDEDLDFFHFIALSTAYGIRAVSGDCERFLLAIKDRGDEFESAGEFISALMALNRMKRYSINTGLGPGNICMLGHRNRDILLIRGNAGDAVGESMEGGVIAVSGNAGADAGGSMADGALIIRGNAGYGAGSFMESGFLQICGSTGADLGYDMKGGLIIAHRGAGTHAGHAMTEGHLIIRGHAGDCLGHTMEGGVIEAGSAGKEVGKRMTGGRIEIHGDYESLGDNIQGGTIYHKGEKIFGK